MHGCILYDLDGTLVDSRADLAAAVNHGRTHFGLAPLPEATIVGWVGEGVRKLVAAAIPEVPEQLDAAVERVLAFYGNHLLDRTGLYPGVTATLTRFHVAGWRQAVVTNKISAMSEPILRGLGVWPLLDALVGGGDSPRMKPDPAPLRLALERAGWQGPDAQVWMVGDHYTDLESARRAGIQRCFCRYGFGDPRGETWDLAVDNLEDLANRLL